MGKNFKIAISLIFISLTLILLIYRQLAFTPKPVVKEKILLDTLVTIKVYEKNEKKASQSIEKAFKQMAEIERIANNFDPKSELSMLNRKAGSGLVKVSPHLFEMIELSQKYYKKLDGAFDITILPLVELWGFGKRKEPPSESEIQSKISLIDMGKIEINRKKHTISLPPHMSLDLGGISKGYAVDQAIAILRKEGIKAALVTTGSTTRTLGQKPGRKPWQVGIQHPRKANDLMGIVEIDQKSISTSGDYQRFFIKNGRRFHHILNPKTGYPAEGIISVNVITDRSCAEADILSTGIFVLGYPRGMRFIEKERDIEGIIVTSDGKVHLSRGIVGKIKKGLTQIF